MKKQTIFFSLLINVLTSAFAQIPTNGLVGYWPLDGDAADASVNSNTGTVHGAVKTFDLNNQADLAYYFDGTDDYIEISDQDYLSFGNGVSDTPFTISFWMKPIFNGTHRAVISKWDQYTAGVEYIIFTTPSKKLRFQIEDESTSRKKLTVESVNEIDETVWTNVTVTYDGNMTAGGLKLYMNGTLSSSTIVNNDPEYVAMENTTQNVCLGRHIDADGNAAFFKGSMDEVRIYDRELTVPEITTIYIDGQTQNVCSIIYCNGENVGIGTDTPDSKLTVNGTIHTKEVKVDLNGFPAPDFVFEEDYNLSSLAETEQYIQTNKHLPEIPSAGEMEANGINLKELNLKLLQKVEELTLHLIEQNKQIKSIMEENRNLKALNEKLTLIENKLKRFENEKAN
ncbi:MAG: tail fiber protein [Cytophagales bacterium]|nr:tail fiber protein [Cytophagales bacterium]